jgi:predicted esterase
LKNIQIDYLRVEKKARIFSLGHLSATTKSIHVVLHGYGQDLHSFINKFNHLPDSSFVYAPEGLSRFYWDKEHTLVGANWMTKEDRLIDIEEYVQYLDSFFENYLSHLNALPIYLHAFSQGVPTALRWLAKSKHQIKVNNLILWGSSLPDDVDMKLVFPKIERLSFCIGQSDPYYKSNEINKIYLDSKSIFEETYFFSFEGKHELNRELISNFDLNFK